MTTLMLTFILSTVSPPAWAVEGPCDRYLHSARDWKLIRDRLPERFLAEGSAHIVDRVTDQDELRQLLLRKLLEEVREFSENPSPEEMADIQEVLSAIQLHFGLSPLSIAAEQDRKRQEKGAFTQGFVMKLGKTLP